MIETISSQIKEAMKAKDKMRLTALRYIKSMLLENKTSKKPIDEQAVVIKYHKKLNDSLEMYQGKDDKIEEIQSEIAVVKEFMPKQLEEADVVALIKEIKAPLENPNMGTIMRELSPKIKGKYDGKLASKLVVEALK
jgi:uncharacterized protein